MSCANQLFERRPGNGGVGGAQNSPVRTGQSKHHNPEAVPAALAEGFFT